MNAEDDPPDLCYLGAAFPDDTSDDFIGHSHLVSLMRAPAPTSSPGQRGQSWNGHISDILFFQVFSIFSDIILRVAPGWLTCRGENPGAKSG